MWRADLGGVGRSLGGGKMVREVREHVGPGGCDAPLCCEFPPEARLLRCRQKKRVHLGLDFLQVDEMKSQGEPYLERRIRPQFSGG